MNKEKITEQLNLPKDIMLGAPLLNIQGRTDVFIENYRGIIEYTGKIIKVQTKTGKIMIIGKNIRIVHYTNEDMHVKGILEEIKYY